jgi:thiosulfate/3-mercaptopyruvate sulfurtransferase
VGLRPLISTGELAQRLSDPQLRIVDLRWRLGQPGSGRELYGAGHIPGAIHLDVDTDLAARPGPGRHPLPTPEACAARLGQAGIGDEHLVVVYDDLGGSIAARLWWMLCWLGHDQVALLDGGITRWQAEGRPLAAELPNFIPARFTARPRPEMLVDRDAVERLRRQAGALILDARAAERYRGELEPIDPRAGHIPGAANAPYQENLAGPSDPRFRAAEALGQRYRSLGADRAQTIVCYCGSGVTACHDLLALELAGVRGAKLYPGSWSDWSADPSRPIATGAEP